MSDQIGTHHVQQYATNITMTAQQKASRLRRAVRVETTTGRRQSFDQVGSAEAVEKTGRHTDTPLIHTPHSRRWANISDWVWADLIDGEDRVKLLVDPQSRYVTVGAGAMGRRMDRLIIAAFNAAAASGQEGAGSVAFPAAQQVAVNYVESGAAANSNLTIGKIRRAAALLDAAEVEEDNRFFAFSASQKQSLLGTTEVTSSDFNTVKALVNGEINTFMGFTFIRTELLPLVVATDVRTCFAWHMEGVGLAVNTDIQSRVSERADKNYATQVWFKMGLGAVRIEEARVVEVACDQSP